MSCLLTVASTLVGTASADPYRWCAIGSVSGGTNCGFVTMEQCRASISGVGGVCEPKQIVPTSLSPAAKAAAPKTDASGGKDKLMECVTDSCKINCSPNIAPEIGHSHSRHVGFGPKRTLLKGYAPLNRNQFWT